VAVADEALDTRRGDDRLDELGRKIFQISRHIESLDTCM
jgi:hypothetical protein